MDIGVKLWESIEREFRNAIEKDMMIVAFEDRLGRGAAGFGDVSEYANRLGEIAGEVLRKHLKKENLPNGKIYWNIAQKTIRPILKMVHELVNEAAAAVQKQEDKKIGISLKPIKPPFPEDRAKDLIGKIVAESMKEENE